jgi:nitrogen regulatory protein PII
MSEVRKKVEIVIEAAGQRALTELLDRLQVRGYTLVTGVVGKGERGLRRADDPFDVSGNILAFAVVPEAQAERIVAGTLELLKARAGIVLVSDVTVYRPERF